MLRMWLPLLMAGTAWQRSKVTKETAHIWTPEQILQISDSHNFFWLFLLWTVNANGRLSLFPWWNLRTVNLFSGSTSSWCFSATKEHPSPSRLPSPCMRSCSSLWIRSQLRAFLLTNYSKYVGVFFSTLAKRSTPQVHFAFWEVFSLQMQFYVEKKQAVSPPSPSEWTLRTFAL